MSIKLVRMLRGYEKDGGTLLFELALDSIPLGDLRAFYSLAENNPMYDCYPLSEEAERLIRKQTSLPVLDYDNREYFLECDAEYPG